MGPREAPRPRPRGRGRRGRERGSLCLRNARSSAPSCAGSSTAHGSVRWCRARPHRGCSRWSRGPPDLATSPGPQVCIIPWSDASSRRPTFRGPSVPEVRRNAFYDIRAQRSRGPNAPARIASRPRLARHLEEADFEPLYILYSVADVLRRFPARTISHLLGGPHGLLALPKGDADQLAALAVTKGEETFEAVLLPQLGQDVFSDIVHPFVQPPGGTLQGTHPRVHGLIAPFSRVVLLPAGNPLHGEHDVIR